MPRISGKINAHEREICARVKLFRECIGWTQDRFSNQIGISLNQLAGIEYARIPLRYGVAWRIREKFKLALSWIANGKYPPNQPDLDPWPKPNEAAKSQSLLSEVERPLLLMEQNTPGHREAERLWWEDRKKKKAEGSPRKAYSDLLKGKIDDWIAKVPDGQLEIFTATIFECSEEYIKEFTNASNESTTNLAIRAMIWAKMREEINNRLAEESKIKELTDASHPVIDGDVKSPVPGFLEEVKKFAATPAKRKELVDFLKAPRESVSRWLNREREPGMEVTLKMIQWVSDQKRQK